MRRRVALLGEAGAILAGACARVGPVSRPSQDGATRIYWVAELQFQAPADWRADGGPREVKLVSPAGDARLEVRATATPGPAAACLSGAEEALARGAA